MERARLLLALAGAALAVPLGGARAQTAPEARTFQPPAGCTAFVTVQSASCSVAHHFTCAADPPDSQRRVDMDESGIALADLIDRETQWLEVTFFPDGYTERIAPSNPDPASFDTLLAAGVDSYDFTTESPQYGTTRYVGEDRLTGESVTIDGVPLEVTDFDMTAYDSAGTELWVRRGSGYIHRDWRLFFGGHESTTTDGVTTPLDDTPVEFIFPGERGFLGVEPHHGCGAVMSKGPRMSPVPEGQG